MLGTPARNRRFATTQWGTVLAACELGSPGRREALSDLCGMYWYPIYAYIRRRGATADEAEDLTQGFFAHVLEKNALGAARRERGRFRSFLLASLRHFLINEWDRRRALKRDDTRCVPIDVEEADRRYARETAHRRSPEEIFERRWAQTVLRAALDRLRDEAEKGAHPERVHRLLPCLTGDGDRGYREVAAELNMTTSAVKVAVHRLRRRYGRLVREEVARTVRDPERVDDEIRHLLAAAES